MTNADEMIIFLLSLSLLYVCLFNAKGEKREETRDARRHFSLRRREREKRERERKKERERENSSLLSKATRERVSEYRHRPSTRFDHLFRMFSGQINGVIHDWHQDEKKRKNVKIIDNQRPIVFRLLFSPSMIDQTDELSTGLCSNHHYLRADGETRAREIRWCVRFLLLDTGH